MTSIATAFGALPLLFATGAGAESRQAIGVVVFYGVMISVFMTLLVVPAVYAIVARRTKSPQTVARMLEMLRAAVPGRTASRWRSSCRKLSPGGGNCAAESTAAANRTR